MFQDCLRIREALLGKYHVQTSRTYYSMGCSLHQEGNYADALLALRRTMRISAYLKDIARQNAVREYIEWVLQKQSDSPTKDQEQVNYYQEQLEDSIQWEQTGDAAAASAEAGADGTNDRADRESALSVAVAAYEQSLAIERSAVTESSLLLHLDVADLYIKLASMKTRIGTNAHHHDNNDDGDDHEWEKARAIYERVWGSDHPYTVCTANKRNPTEAMARIPNSSSSSLSSPTPTTTVEDGSEGADSDDDGEDDVEEEDMAKGRGGAFGGKGTTGRMDKMRTFEYPRSMSESSMTSATSQTQTHSHSDDDDNDNVSTGSHGSSSSSSSGDSDGDGERATKTTKSKTKKTLKKPDKDAKGGSQKDKKKKKTNKKKAKDGEDRLPSSSSSVVKKKDKAKKTKKSAPEEGDGDVEESKSTSKKMKTKAKTKKKVEDASKKAGGSAGEDGGMGKTSQSDKKKKKTKKNTIHEQEVGEEEPAEEWYSF